MDERALRDEIDKLKAEFAAFGTQKPLSKRGSADRVARAERDKAYFGEIYFPHRVRKPNDGEIVTPEHRELLRLCDIRDTPKLYLAYRGFAKSTWATVIDTLHKLVFKQFHAGVIGSYDSNTAINNFTSAIYMELLTNPRLQQDFGDLLNNAPRSGVGDFITNTGVRLAARGIGEMVKGFNNPLNSVRLDLFRGDDLQKRESARSPKQVRSLMDWLWEEVYFALREPIDGGSFFDISGTCVDGGTDAMTQMMQDDERAMLKLIVPFVLESPSRVIDTRNQQHPTETVITEATGRPQWAARYSPELAEEKKRNAGLSRYSAEMQQRPLSATHRKFRVKEWTQYLAPYGAIPVPDWRTHTQIVCRVDPSNTASGDRKAIVVLSSSPEDWRIYIRHVFLQQCSIEELLEKMAEVRREFRCRIGIEENGPKDWIWNTVNIYQREHSIDLGLYPINNTLNKELRISEIESPYQRGVLVFQHGHTDQKNLLEEAEMYPDFKFDDGLDAWAGAYSEMELLKARESRRPGHLSTGHSRPIPAVSMRQVLAYR